MSSLYNPGTPEDVALADEINSCSFGEAMSIEELLEQMTEWTNERTKNEQTDTDA